MSYARRGTVLAVASSVVALASAVVLVTASSAGAGVSAQRSNPQGANWPGFLFGPTHSSFNAAAQAIKPSGVANLREIFRWFPPASKNAGNNGLGTTTPAVVNNVAYFGANDGMFYAVDLVHHKMLWQHFLGIATPLTCKGVLGLTASPVVAKDPVTKKLTVYENAPDGHMWAMDALTGAVVWKSVVALPSATQNTYYAWGSALVARGEVYVGIAGSCGNPTVLGAGLVAFNQATGKRTGFWDGQQTQGVGSNIGVWSTPVVAPNGDIIVATANSDTDGQPLYADSVVALKSTTLTLKTFWQLPAPQRSPDSDFGAPPNVFPAVVDGKTTTLVGVCNKNGVYYAFHANDLTPGPVWQYRVAGPYVGGSPNLCDAGAVWDGRRLIEAGGNSTTINGVTYPGSVQALDPSTGAVQWQTGLPGAPFGSATEDGGGVVTVPVFISATGATGVYLLDAKTGGLLGTVPMPGSNEYSQAVFAGSNLIIGGGPNYGLGVYGETRTGSPITVSPSVLVANGRPSTVTVTGKGLLHSELFVSGGLLPKTVTVNSSTSVTLTFDLPATMATSSYNITAISPGPGSRPTAHTCVACLQVDASPNITTLNPSSVVQGQSGQAITVTGTGFAPGVRVTGQLGLKFQTIFASGTQLQVSASVDSSIAPGTYTIFAINTDGGSFRCTNCLTVTAP